MEWYSISFGDINNYPVYSRTIDAIIEAAGTEISRNGFDHLVWYYYKGRKIENINSK